jgi:hypothetical protein
MQSPHSLFPFTLLIAVLAHGAMGCETGYPCADTTDASRATFSGAAPDWVRPDGGGEAVENSTPFSFTAAASVEIADVTGGATPEGTCIWISTGGGSDATNSINVGVGFDCVTGPGTYRLEDLHATACNSGSNLVGGDQVCGVISGTLTVRAFARPCGDNGACGHLDADLAVSTPPGSAITLSGRATLAYDQTMLECHEPVVSLGGG